MAVTVRTDLVVVYVARRAGDGWQLLQLRRTRADDEYRGTFQTVMGGIEPGEHAVAAALRELREETALAPVEFYRLGVCPTFYRPQEDAVWQAPAFLAVVAGEPTLNHEHDAHRWVDAAAADAHFIWPSDRAAIAHLRAELLADGVAKPYLRVVLP